MVDLIMRKRRALPGEIGLFPAAEMWEENLSRVKMDTDVTVTATTKRTQRQMAKSWVIAKFLCDASEDFTTKEDARDALLIECGHFTRKFDRLRQQAIISPKPTSNLDGTDFEALLRRMVDAIATVFLPNLADSEAKRELEKIIAPDLVPDEPAPEPGRGDVQQRTHENVATTVNAPSSDHPPEMGHVPQNRYEYIDAVRNWIANQAIYSKAVAYFRGEDQIALRRRLNVSPETTRLLEAEIAEHFNVKEPT